MSEEHVGYGRPPAASRFKRGVSGNPKGRPKGSKNFSSDLRDELASLLPSHSGVQITKQRAIINRLVADAIAGDGRAIATIVGHFLKKDDASAESEDFREREILKQFRTKKEDDHEGP